MTTLQHYIHLTRFPSPSTKIFTPIHIFHVVKIFLQQSNLWKKCKNTLGLVYIIKEKPINNFTLNNKSSTSFTLQQTEAPDSSTYLTTNQLH